jgi:hypothetical protein
MSCLAVALTFPEISGFAAVLRALRRATVSVSKQVCAGANAGEGGVHC